MQAPMWLCTRSAAHELARRLRDAGGGVAIVPTAPERVRNADSDHPYRYDSYFHYLTGFGEPGAWLVLDGDGRSELFCRPRDPEREIWDGYRLGPAAPRPQRSASTRPGRSVELDDKLPALLAHQSARVDARSACTAGSNRASRRWLAAVRARAQPRHRMPGDATQPVRAARRDAARRRTRSSCRRCAARRASRPARMCARCAFARHAARRSPTRRCASTRSRPSCCTSSAATARSRPPIRASSPPARMPACCTTPPATRVLRAGELCLIDAGCELDGYASDVTRTWPANGRFSAAQRELYDIVLAAQEAAVAHTRPGARKTRRALGRGARARARHARRGPARRAMRTAASTT